VTEIRRTPDSLAQLEQAATAGPGTRRPGPDAVITCDRLVRIYTVEGIEIQALQ